MREDLDTSATKNGFRDTACDIRTHVWKLMRLNEKGDINMEKKINNKINNIINNIKALLFTHLTGKW